jgi:hypothetical protein
VFESAGQTCHGDDLQASVDVCRSGNIGMEYCTWREVESRSLGDGVCETNACLLKGLHMLAACPEFWPNITGIGAHVYAAPSKQCTADCAKHFLEFYNNRECWMWLDSAMLCDDSGRANYLSGCQPKPAMQLDANDFMEQCETLMDSWVDSTWFFALCCGAVCAAVGFTTMKCIRRQEKAKHSEAESDVTDPQLTYAPVFHFVSCSVWR